MRTGPWWSAVYGLMSLAEDLDCKEQHDGQADEKEDHRERRFLAGQTRRVLRSGFTWIKRVERHVVPFPVVPALFVLIAELDRQQVRTCSRVSKARRIVASVSTPQTTYLNPCHNIQVEIRNRKPSTASNLNFLISSLSIGP